MSIAVNRKLVAGLRDLGVFTMMPLDDERFQMWELNESSSDSCVGTDWKNEFQPLHGKNSASVV